MDTGTNTGNENNQSQGMNHEHSDNIKAGEHANQQDETQYGKIRESEAGKGTEQRADNLRDQVNKRVNNVETETNDWADKAEKKMDKADDKIRKAQEKLGHNSGNYSSDKDNTEDYEKRNQNNRFNHENNNLGLNR